MGLSEDHSGRPGSASSGRLPQAAAGRAADHRGPAAHRRGGRQPVHVPQTVLLRSEPRADCPQLWWARYAGCGWEMTAPRRFPAHGRGVAADGAAIHRRHRRRPAPECASHHSGGVLAHPSHSNRCVRLHRPRPVAEIPIGRRHLHRHPSPAPRAGSSCTGEDERPGGLGTVGATCASATSDRQRTGTVPSSVMCPCSSRLLIGPVSVMLGQSGAAPSSGQPYTSKSFQNGGAVSRGSIGDLWSPRRSGTGGPPRSTAARRYSWPPVSTTGSWPSFGA